MPFIGNAPTAKNGHGCCTIFAANALSIGTGATDMKLMRNTGRKRLNGAGKIIGEFMPTVQIGAAIPDGKVQLARKFKYNMWAMRAKQYDLSERSLKFTMFQMHTHIRFCYHACLLISDMWDLIRSAFRKPTQNLYDKKFDDLMAIAYSEYQDYLQLVSLSSPYAPSSAPSTELYQAIRGAHRHLSALCDKSGFGNKMLKTHDDDSRTNVMS